MTVSGCHPPATGLHLSRVLASFPPLTATPQACEAQGPGDKHLPPHWAVNSGFLLGLLRPVSAQKTQGIQSQRGLGEHVGLPPHVVATIIKTMIPTTTAAYTSHEPGAMLPALFSLIPAQPTGEALLHPHLTERLTQSPEATEPWLSANH
jgi:hypothetical protein